MKIQPTNNQNFNGIYKFTKPTSYGKRIHGGSARGFDYDVYVANNEQTGNIEHKLYCVFKDNNWVKSFLRYFSGNKLSKELRSSKGNKS